MMSKLIITIPMKQFKSGKLFGKITKEVVKEILSKHYYYYSMDEIRMKNQSPIQFINETFDVDIYQNDEVLRTFTFLVVSERDIKFLENLRINLSKLEFYMKQANIHYKFYELMQLMLETNTFKVKKFFKSWTKELDK